ncbi:hypothetical protein ACS0TY_010901 [Phlomoides rotata]
MDDLIDFFYWRKEFVGDELVEALQLKNKIPRRKTLSSLKAKVLTILERERALLVRRKLPLLLELHSHSYFHKAIARAIRWYLKLNDSPAKSSSEEDEEISKFPPTQKKKSRQKQRRVEARAKKVINFSFFSFFGRSFFFQIVSY